MQKFYNKYVICKLGKEWLLLLKNKSIDNCLIPISISDHIL
jgi:hypothetical protein